MRRYCEQTTHAAAVLTCIDMEADDPASSLTPATGSIGRHYCIGATFRITRHTMNGSGEASRSRLSIASTCGMVVPNGTGTKISLWSVNNVDRVAFAKTTTGFEWGTNAAS